MSTLVLTKAVTLPMPRTGKAKPRTQNPETKDAVAPPPASGGVPHGYVFVHDTALRIPEPSITTGGAVFVAEPKPSVDEMVSAVQEKMLREREIKYRFVFEVMVDNVQSFTRIYKIVEM